MSDPTTSEEADRHGYTQRVIIEGEELGIGIDAFIKPGTDTDRTFKAFDCNHQRTVTLDGSKVTVRDNS